MSFVPDRITNKGYKTKWKRYVDATCVILGVTSPPRCLSNVMITNENASLNSQYVSLQDSKDACMIRALKMWNQSGNRGEMHLCDYLSNAQFIIEEYILSMGAIYVIDKINDLLNVV